MSWLDAARQAVEAAARQATIDHMAQAFANPDRNARVEAADALRARFVARRAEVDEAAWARFDRGLDTAVETQSIEELVAGIDALDAARQRRL